MSLDNRPTAAADGLSPPASRMSAARCPDSRGARRAKNERVTSLRCAGNVNVRDPQEAGRQAIDGVAGAGERTVPAGIGHFQREVRVAFLGGLDRTGDAACAERFEVAAVEVQAELGVNQIAVLGEQPLDAVRRAAFLVGREREDHVAIGTVAFLDELDDVGRHDRGAVLHVLGAAAVEEAVALEQRERVHRPVLAPRLDDVEVRQEKQRPLRAGAPKPRHEVALRRCRADHLDVGRRQAGLAQASRNGLGRRRRRAVLVGGIDADQLAEDVARQRLRSASAMGSGRQTKRDRSRASE